MFGRREPRKDVIARIERLEEEVRHASRKADEVMQDLRDLSEKHLKLRGKIYALKMHKPEGDEVPTALTRDDIRKQLAQSGRFVPGKPVSHT